MSDARVSPALPLLVLLLAGLGTVGCSSSDTGYRQPEPVKVSDAKDLATLPLADAGTPGADAASGQSRSVEARKVEQIEKRLNAMETELAELRPAIKRLVLVEYDIRVLLDKMETVAYRDAADRGSGRKGAEEPGAPLAGAQLVPLGSSSPPPAAPQAGERATLSIEPARVPGPPTEVAKAAGAAGAFGLHLASYAGQASLVRGWSVLQRRFARELAGMQYTEQSVELGGTRGRVLRLVAGPLEDHARAQAACGSIERAGQYCKVVRF